MILFFFDISECCILLTLSGRTRYTTVMSDSRRLQESMFKLCRCRDIAIDVCLVTTYLMVREKIQNVSMCLQY